MFFCTAGYCGSYGELSAHHLPEKRSESHNQRCYSISQSPYYRINGTGIFTVVCAGTVNFPNMDPMFKKLQKLTLFEELHHLANFSCENVPKFYARQAGHASKPKIIKHTLSKRDAHEANQQIFKKERRRNFYDDQSTQIFKHIFSNQKKPSSCCFIHKTNARRPRLRFPAAKVLVVLSG